MRAPHCSEAVALALFETLRAEILNADSVAEVLRILGEEPDTPVGLAVAYLGDRLKEHADAALHALDAIERGT